MQNFEEYEQGSKVPRTYEFYLVAYFLSRYGSATGGRTVAPPEKLGARRWNEAYDFFYDAISGGRDQLTFRRSLKNARDSFDSHFRDSGRIGWRDTDAGRSPARLSKIAIQVREDWASRTEDNLFGRISEVVRRSRSNQGWELPSVRAAHLGLGKFGRQPGIGRGGKPDRTYMIGKEAEEWVVDYLKRSLGDATQDLRHHSTLNETPGYDISYIDGLGQTQAIEVKGTTSSAFTSFELTANEFRAAKDFGANYTIWLITNVGNYPMPFLINNPYGEMELGNLEVTPSEWRVRGVVDLLIVVSSRANAQISESEIHSCDSGYQPICRMGHASSTICTVEPPGELMDFHELYQEGLQLNQRAFYDMTRPLTCTIATGQVDLELATAISNDMAEADRKFPRAAAEWANVQARYK